MGIEDVWVVWLCGILHGVLLCVFEVLFLSFLHLISFVLGQGDGGSGVCGIWGI